MRAFLAVLLLLCPLVACGGDGGDDGGDDSGKPPPECVDGTDFCTDKKCIQDGLPLTTLTGRVFAPNGTLPLYGVNVYVPSKKPGAFPEGAQCSRCSDALLGEPIAVTESDANGNFTLVNVPVGKNIPLVINTGKWRRQLTIPVIERCKVTEVGQAETRLPANKSEGDIPKIAITTGDADTMECLVRKLGVSDTEIGTSSDSSSINLYRGDGVASFDAGFAGGKGTIPDATPFWSSVDNLRKYDVVILSCEGEQNANRKPQTALDAMKEYADLGGRVFASHWHNIWISGHFDGAGEGQKPEVWDTIGQWNDGENFNNAITDVIDEDSNPKGGPFANWMVNVKGSTTRGELPVVQARTTSVQLDKTRAEQWVFTRGGEQEGMLTVPSGRAQMFQFTTPNEDPLAKRCGKVVFTDMHVSLDPADPIKAYPEHCLGGNELSPQEKALAFMFFDISSCVGTVL